MFVSEFACPCCGTLIQPANPIQVGRQVQCFACRTTFVVPAKSEDVAPPELPMPAPLPSGYPLQTGGEVWIKKRETDHRRARGHFRRTRQGPNIGLIAFLITGGVSLVVLLVLVGVLAYRQFRPSGLTPNQARIVGIWDGDFGRNGNGSFDFRSNGELVVIIDRPEHPQHEEQRGTWKVVGENGKNLTIRLMTRSTTGEAFDITTEFTFHGENAFTVPERNATWHRRGSK